jgi:hypothetical protein
MIHHLQVERHLRMLLLEIRDPQRQEIKRQGLTAGNQDGASSQAAQIFDVRFHPPSIGDLAAGIANKHLSCGRQFDAARPAFEQGGPNFGFEILNAAVHGRWRQVQVLRSLSDGAHAGDLDDVGQQLQMPHGISSKAFFAPL